MMLTRHAPKLAIPRRTDSNESNEQQEAQHRTVKYGEHLFEAMLTGLVRIRHRLSSFRPGPNEPVQLD